MERYWGRLGDNQNRVSKINQQVKVNTGYVGTAMAKSNQATADDVDFENTAGWNVSKSTFRRGKLESGKWKIVSTYSDLESSSAGILVTHLGAATCA